MSDKSQVTDAEVAAILDLVRPTAEELLEVAPRDFKAPRRLSRTQLDMLSRRAEKVMVDVGAHLSSWLRAPHRAAVESVTEAHSGAVIDALVDPMRVLAFDVGPQLGLVTWDTAAMVGAVETALGAADTKAAAARELSTVEERILADMLTRVATLVASSLGVEAKNPRVLREKKALVLADDLTVNDPQRIAVHVAVTGPAGDGTVHVYVPAVKAPEPPKPAANKDAKKAGMPGSFADIDLEMHAELGSVIVALQDVLALEIGDVIVLDTKVGDAVALTAEGEVRAHGDLGQRDGKLALRLRSVERRAPKKTDGN